jgi:5'-deoxynucleotidase YfbR-like HD superfamily hydrolase
MRTFKETSFRPVGTPPRVYRLLGLAYSRVPRWEDGIHPAVNPKETVLDHVEATLEIPNEISKTHPIFSASVNIITVKEMLLIHEIDEIRAGDLPLSHPQYLQLIEQWQAKGKDTVEHLTENFITDPIQRARVRESYRQYELRDKGNKEGLLANLLDMIQGTRYGLEHVFNCEPDARESMEQILKYSVPLCKLLQGPAKEDFESFVAEEFAKYSIKGFDEIGKEGLGKFKSAIRETSDHL